MNIYSTVEIEENVDFGGKSDTRPFIFLSFILIILISILKILINLIHNSIIHIFINIFKKAKSISN